MEISQLKSALDALSGKSDFVSLRFVSIKEKPLSLEKGVLVSPSSFISQGVMITVYNNGGYGYSATANTSLSGLTRCFEDAKKWADASAGKSVLKFSADLHEKHVGSYSAIPKDSFYTLNVSQKIELLQKARGTIAESYNCVHDAVYVSSIIKKDIFVSSVGTEFEQEIELISPDLEYTVANEIESATRNLAKLNMSHQGGVESLERCGFFNSTERLLSEAKELLSAPVCPSGKRDLLVMPSQMLLQIHESIGHPLELDRILGDERNFAGTSFVTPDMFGSFQYGSELLNVSFDPSVIGQNSSCAFDDEGTPAKKEMLIENGVLKRGIGGKISQVRSELAGTSSARAVSWWLPPIDRMGNINLEPGETSLKDMIASIEKGILVDNNVSWSIDDSRNKFQFGCEWGKLIENGELKGMVKNPNYRGISQDFWRSLKAVGDEDSYQVMGSPVCGKGEPSQTIFVGHASPACLFDGVEVFGE